jgi:hypothetical protein
MAFIAKDAKWHFADVVLEFQIEVDATGCCTDTEILGHLRGAGPHVLGCWALHLLLWKS